MKTILIGGIILFGTLVIFLYLMIVLINGTMLYICYICFGYFIQQNGTILSVDRVEQKKLKKKKVSSIILPHWKRIDSDIILSRYK